VRRSSKRRSGTELTPNAPIDRLKHIIKIYGEKQPWVVLDTISVILPTVGIDDRQRFVREGVASSLNRGEIDPTRFSRLAYSLLWASFRDGTPAIHPGYSRSLAHQENQETLSYIIDIVSHERAMREPSEADSIFPWVARELSKLTKHTIAKLDSLRPGGDEGGDEDAEDYDDESIRAEYAKRVAAVQDYQKAMDILQKSGNAIAQWAKATRSDIMKMSLAEVIHASRGFRAKIRVEHGEVVYKFKNGWTVESLKGKRQLDCEAGFLAHCVYNYENAVDVGTSVIYSLRDPDGVPYVTMEWQRDCDETLERFTRGCDETLGRFTQIFGHTNSTIGSEVFGGYVFQAGQNNDPPLTHEEVPEVVEAIRAMVIEFIDKKMGGEPRGILMAGGSLRGRNLRGRNLNRANLTEADLTGADLTGAGLSGAYLDGANLRDANLGAADLRGARYDHSTVWPRAFDPAAAGAVLRKK